MRNNIYGGGCERYEVIQHEIGHAIGFWHEQSRPDHDRYVTINTKNIQMPYNFLKRKYFEIDNQASSYDNGSIMHYGQRAFATPEDIPPSQQHKPCMEPVAKLQLLESDFLPHPSV